MKKNHLIIITAFLVLALPGQAQRTDAPMNMPKFDYKKIHFGFGVGVNTANFYIRNSDTFFDAKKIRKVYGIESYQAPGFHLGPIFNVHLGNHFDFRLLYTLTFIQRNLKYNLRTVNAENEVLQTTHTMKIASTFSEFPVQFKFKSVRINDYRFYLIAGANYKLDMANKRKIPEELRPMIRLKRHDIYGEIGLGLDFYLKYFKLSPEIKFGAGLLDMTVRDDTEFTGAMKYLRSKMIMLSFHFES